MEPLIMLKEFKDGNRIIKQFQIMDYISPDPSYAIAVSMGHVLGKGNELEDLPPQFENMIIKHFQKDIMNLRNHNTQFYLGMDITHFPFITTYIDQSDSKFKDDPDNFSRDIKRLWDQNSKSHIIMIVVNLHTSHSGLKHIPF